jgi:hypothetical protein
MLAQGFLRDGVFASVVGRTLKTPFSNPACCARYARLNAVKGVSGDGFAIIVHPAARAAPALRKTILPTYQLQLSQYER